ncbi:MAG: hypothetical protein COB04_14620 [Gammaproteobacteria bacterium]|nr:MAG: hypothetical protein COB04_14620 [Gammaproteobacteria bacterium]
MKTSIECQGAGLGLRRTIIDSLHENLPQDIDFFEVAPENWINVGGRLGKQLRAISEQVPLTTHGLSLSVGGVYPLDKDLIRSIKSFLDTHQCPIYSEHLSYSNDGGQLYDLLPMPFTEEAVHHVAERIGQVQDILGRRMAIENVSYYLTPEQAMSEADFVSAVVKEADCDLLLDVNNVYVNSINHNYDPQEFIRSMPAERVSYYHMAGHHVEDDGFIIDSHGADVIDPVWDLLAFTYDLIGVRPTLLERDFNMPDMASLQDEVKRIKQFQNAEELPSGRSAHTAA